MRAAVVDEAGFTTRRDLPQPVPADGEVLIKVLGSGMCGSDLHVFERDPNYAWVNDRFPLVMGHEIVGRRVHSPARGAGSHPAAPNGAEHSGAEHSGSAPAPAGTDSLVVIRPRAGHNPDGSPIRIGWDRAGGFAEYLTAPEECVYDLAPGIDPLSAALCEPLAVASSGLRRSGTLPRLGPDFRAQVVGMGAIGALAACALVAEGCQDVEIVGTEHDRAMGSFEVLEGLGLQPVLPEAASSQRDLVANAAGSPQAFETAAARLARRGVLLNIALGIGQVKLDADLLVRNETSIVSTYGSEAVDWETSVGYLSSGAVQPGPIVSHTVPLEEIVTGFQLLERREARKVIVDIDMKG